MPTNQQQVKTAIEAESFGQRLLEWFDREGRKHLPWQKNRTPYRVWLSEVMLQQTQVSTVVPYFQRFTERYPTVDQLAKAKDDDVLHLWTGLGYYARARNLLKTARVIHEDLDGQFPTTVDALSALPGIGRSTAGAIISLSMGQRAAILDGNVKRVLCRHHKVMGWPDRSETLRRLWAITEEVTPMTRVADYTQGIMDLGATVCTRANPACDRCPLNQSCLAFAEGLQDQLPEKKPKKKLPVRNTQLIVPRLSDGRVRLTRRPEQGVWGGLWSFTELPGEDDPAEWWLTNTGTASIDAEPLESIEHTFSHFHLIMAPVLLHINDPMPGIADVDSHRWVDPAAPDDLGLPAPIVRLLKSLASPA
jgi:A/G-specific adenine glycosylase